ncbi:hypothetical protein MYSTI_03676 [Myxococcus stipitatus DSM 14675]|uniref:Tetratricopeptide repeat protein n=1 Tax=Myxococcus stipitatus (strain DSM 14675 / JCM 12634 / Mx s8) TaxID=1278073 RepID=L7UBN6_MYXSD|nr:tetratricopeptide repeat protein [Myxococcus stipitatus]AGC44982.1 hypothetical protein MYSTI_03676 [Myxococcus stipitatus DSM 14675]
MLFGSKTPPSRSELITEADLARSKGRLNKAISGYRKALELEPKDAIVLGKLAPLLARTRQAQAALESFRAAAQAHLDKGFADKAQAVYAQATELFPLELELWRQVAQLHVQKGHRAEAVKTLLRGRLHFRRSSERPGAILLLRETLALDATLFEVKLDLVLQLARQREREEALAMLEPLAAEARGPRQVRKLRWTQAQVTPGLGTFLAWLRAWVLGR